MALFVIYVLHILSFLHVSTQNPFECYVPEPSIRVMQLKLHQDYTELRVVNETNPIDSNLDLKTYVVVHGWIGYPSKKSTLSLGKALATAENNTVLYLDYSKWSRKFYNCAKKMVKVAGEALSEYIITSVNNKQINLDTLHFLGHSLGAHVSGLAGRIIFSKLKKKVHRITGLDPAAPSFTQPFTDKTDGLTLRSSDASIVDVLHTTRFLGTEIVLGTVDFFAETAHDVGIQPGCLYGMPVICSHIIAIKYYIESITSCGMRAEKLLLKDGSVSEEDNEVSQEPVVFGHHMNENLTGVYGFMLHADSPYGNYATDCSSSTNDINDISE